MAGRKLQQWNGDTHTIDMTALANGAYFIKLMLTNGSYTVQKLVKE